MEYTYNNAKMQDVIQAYRQKMLSTRKGVSATPVSISPKQMEFTVKREMPLWAARFFNLNDFEYNEIAKINEEENTIEIASSQTIAKVTMKFNMTLFFDTDENSTKATALIVAENVPKLLNKTVESYTKKQFTKERTIEMNMIEKKY
jgi:hypothetical protein